MFCYSMLEETFWPFFPIQDIKWQVGYQYTPADALAQGLKSLSLNDTRVLARTIADWLEGLNQ